MIPAPDCSMIIAAVVVSVHIVHHCITTPTMTMSFTPVQLVSY